MISCFHFSYSIGMIKPVPIREIPLTPLPDLLGDPPTNMDTCQLQRSSDCSEDPIGASLSMQVEPSASMTQPSMSSLTNFTRLSLMDVACIGATAEKELLELAGHTCKDIFGLPANNQVHLQKAYGTSEQAIRYCKKGGDFEESGEAPITTAQGRKEALQIKKILEDVCQGKSTDELIMQYPNQLRFITEVSRMRRPRDCIAKCLYLYGNAGCGKTYSTAKVLDQLGLSYYKKCPSNKWFDNYDYQDVIVFEEFTSCLPLCTFLSYTDARPPLM